VKGLTEIATVVISDLGDRFGSHSLAPIEGLEREAAMRLILVFVLGVLLARETRAQESVREVPSQTEFWMRREGALDVSGNGLKNCWRWYERSGQARQLVHFNEKGEGSIISLRGRQRPELKVIGGELFAFCEGRTYRFSPQFEEKAVGGLAVLPITREYTNLWGGRYLCTLPEFVATSETRREMTTQWVEQVQEAFHEDGTFVSPTVEAIAPELPILPPPAPTPVPDGEFREETEPTKPPKPQGARSFGSKVAKL
jgi:hypothetical protein